MWLLFKPAWVRSYLSANWFQNNNNCSIQLLDLLAESLFTSGILFRYLMWRVGSSLAKWSLAWKPNLPSLSMCSLEWWTSGGIFISKAHSILEWNHLFLNESEYTIHQIGIIAQDLCASPSFWCIPSLKWHGLHGQVRMLYCSFWLETDWKETLPWRQLCKRRLAETYKRTESVFVQVFHIGIVPDIFLNESKWRFSELPLFPASKFQAQIPASKSACFTSQESSCRPYCVTPVALQCTSEALIDMINT